MMDTSYDSETLQKLQAVELEMLKVVHNFCVQHEIQYSLAYGTLIGAVRHKGFIPWDDDVDLMMTRKNYDKFIEQWKMEPISGYELVENGIQPGYPNNFLKIRKTGTAFIQTESELSGCDYPLGIFLDVFSFDRMAPVGFKRKKQYYCCLLNMLLTRNYTSGKNGMFGLGEKLLLRLPKKFKCALKKKTKAYIEKWNGTISDDPMLDYCTYDNASRSFPHDMFDEYIELEFEGEKFSAVAKYDEVLKTSFGDYMTLPPVEQRVNHRPLMIDFDHSYGELKNT